MELNISETLSDTLHEIGEIGGKHVYLVGGSVRDLLLNRPNLDIDILVEGDALKVAEQLQSRWKGTLQTHLKFGTATVTPADSEKPKVDFVTARSETYQNPGTLPKVKPGTISEDLHRRDFSINALAMCLYSNTFGSIIDLTGGLEDLKNGTIRVLHDNSYLDDPTRIFRACRYSGRYNFHIVDNDMTLIEQAIPLISKLSGERIRNEIERVLLEDKALQILQKLANLGVYETIYPGWKISPTITFDLQTAQQAISWAKENINDVEFQDKLLLWMAFFGTTKTTIMPKYGIEAICYRLVLSHQLNRITNDTDVLKKDIISEKNIRSVFDRHAILLSDNTTYDFYNGKWCIVDTDNESTYVFGDGHIYQVLTPISAYLKLLSVLETLNETVAPSHIYQVLKPFPIEALVLGCTNSELLTIQRKAIEDYLHTLRKIRPFVTGKDLIEWGEKPGESFDTILSTLFSEQLDGKIKSKSDGFTRFKILTNRRSKKNNTSL